MESHKYHVRFIFISTSHSRIKFQEERKALTPFCKFPESWIPSYDSLKIWDLCDLGFLFTVVSWWDSFCIMDVLNKEMKGASVGFNQFLAIDDGAKAKLNYQTLLNEYLDLQKECVSRKRKLQAANYKRDAILAEVRFLRRRHKHLTSNQDLPHLPNSGLDINASRNQDFDLLMIPNSVVKNGKGEGSEQEHHKGTNSLLAKKLKNSLIHDNPGVVGMREICWPGQFTVKI